MLLILSHFVKKNPKPCPLIGLGAKGDPYLKDLGEIDISNRCSFSIEFGKKVN